MIGLAVFLGIIAFLLVMFAMLMLGYTLQHVELPKQDELMKVRLEAAQAERALHDLATRTFIAMTDTIERRLHG